MNKKDNSIGGDGEECFEGCGPWSDTQDYKRWKSNIKNVFEKIYISQNTYHNDCSIPLLPVELLQEHLLHKWMELILHGFH